MQLDRNITNPRRGKYALIKLRDAKIEVYGEAFTVHSSHVDFGSTPETDFFVIRLKDKYAYPALHAYAVAACNDDHEYSMEVEKLAMKAFNYPGARMPD